MTYILRYKYDRKKPQKVRGLPFATKREAVASGQAVLAAGTGWDLEVINEKGDVVASESEVCTGTASAARGKIRTLPTVC